MGIAVLLPTLTLTYSYPSTLAYGYLLRPRPMDVTCTEQPMKFQVAVTCVHPRVKDMKR